MNYNLNDKLMKSETDEGLDETHTINRYYKN